MKTKVYTNVREIGMKELEEILHSKDRDRIGMTIESGETHWFFSNGDGTAEWEGTLWAPEWAKVLYTLEDFQKEVVNLVVTDYSSMDTIEVEE